MKEEYDLDRVKMEEHNQWVRDFFTRKRVIEKLACNLCKMCGYPQGHGLPYCIPQAQRFVDMMKRENNGTRAED